MVFCWDFLVWGMSQPLFMLSRHLFKGENPTYVIVCIKKKTFNFGLYWDVYWQISFKLGMTIETTKVYILIPVLMTLTFIQCHMYEKSNIFLLILQMFQTMWFQFSLLPQPLGLLKCMLNLFHMINFQGRLLYLHDFIKYTFNICLCQNTCEPFFFSKPGMMLDTNSAVWFQFEWPWPSVKVTELWDS